MSEVTYQVGESFVGSGGNAAHINTVLGSRNGPVGTAWATALATPSTGHVPFMAVVQPGVPVKPPTLFVSKSAPSDDGHGRLIWGPAQAGVAAGVTDAVADGVLDDLGIDEVVLVCAVWVDPAADDADEVFDNNRRATRTALVNGAQGLPGVDEVLSARADIHNPFFTPPGRHPATPAADGAARPS